jgi:superfamily I DNA and RNA helicase
VPIWGRQVSTVIDAVEKEEIPRAQYGALLIDEGHDFEANWLKLVTQMIDPEKDSLLLLYDDAQSIYKKQRDKKKDRLDFSHSSVGIQARGRTTVLKMNYRNTRQILALRITSRKTSFKSANLTRMLFHGSPQRWQGKKVLSLW